MTTTVVAAVDDFFFQTKIKEAARVAGVDVRFAPAAGEAAAAVKELGAPLLIVDLDSRAFAAGDLLRAVRGVKTVGYLPHVRDDLRKQAEADGCQLVLPRSAFVKRLPALLQEARGGQG